MSQLSLPIQCDERPFILGQPVVRSYFDRNSNNTVDVLGGEYSGEDFVYLLHFFGHIGGASHYVGSTKDIPRRIKEHHRKWPLYRLDADSVLDLRGILEAYRLLPLIGRNFRRKHTFLQAVAECLGKNPTKKQDLVLLHAAKRYRSNGLVMAANQQGITWTVAKVWQADRSWEFKLKQQKNTKRFCPVCQGIDLPF